MIFFNARCVDGIALLTIASFGCFSLDKYLRRAFPRAILMQERVVDQAFSELIDSLHLVYHSVLLVILWLLFGFFFFLKVSHYLIVKEDLRELQRQVKLLLQGSLVGIRLKRLLPHYLPLGSASSLLCA